MALENVMRVDGGHIVTGGGAGGNSVEIDWEDWCKLTPEEQETGDWTIINCPWADGDVSVDLMTKLWENPDPTASFVAKNITLASDDYDLLLILSSYSTTNVRMAPASIGLSGYLNFADNSSSSALAMYRAYTASGNKVTFTDNYRNGTVANGYLIPMVIYGIKLTATVKINAIAMDVSTSADKCMLNDGETSVEDEIDRKNVANITGLIAGLTSYSSASNPYTCPNDGYVRFNGTASTMATMYLLRADGTNNYTMGQTKDMYISIFVRKGAKVFLQSAQNAVFLQL